MFSWGTPQVNYAAAHQLTGSFGMLHRMTPFRDFGAVSAAVHGVMPTMEEYFGPFFDPKAMSALPELLQQSPFYQDGSDFFKPLAEFVEEFFEIHEPETGRAKCTVAWSFRHGTRRSKMAMCGPEENDHILSLWSHWLAQARRHSGGRHA